MSELAYFDNAATTFPKPETVYDFANEFYKSSGGNMGRGGNVLAARASAMEREAKVNLLELYACKGKVVAFTASATDALNRILLGLDIRPGDAVCVSPFEHNAVTRVLHHLVEAKGARIVVLSFDPRTMLPDMEVIKGIFEADQPRVVVLTHASNVCGAVIPVRDIFTLAKRACDATTIVDMSQTAGLLPLELSDNLVDYAVFAGHKTLLAPFGVGGFICSSRAKLDPVFFGGNGIDSVEQAMPSDIVDMIQAGSQNTYAIAGLKASTDWVLERGMESLLAQEQKNAERLLETLRGYDRVSVLGEEMECDRIGVVSCMFDEYSPDEAELLLGKLGVAVRSGIQCAPYAHRFLGTLPAGTVRFSVSPLTTEDDFRILENALDEMVRI